MWNRTTPPTAVVNSAGDQVEALRLRITELETRLLRQRQVETQLLENEQLHKSLFQLSFDPVITVNRDARILTANPAAVRLSGYSLSELQGMPLSRLCAPELLNQTLQSFNRALLGDPQDTETAVITKEGRHVPVYCTGGPLITGGQTFGLIVIVHDLSLQKHTEELLRTVRIEAEQRFQEHALRYRQLFVCSSDAVLTGDVERYTFEDANPAAAALLGYSQQELTGLDIYQLSTEADQSAANRDRMLHGPHPQLLRFHRKLRRKDGSVFLADVSLGTFLVNSRVKFVGSFRDISDRLRLERELLDIAQREQRRMSCDLQESVCQQLARVALLCRDLTDRLAPAESPAGDTAKELAGLVDSALTEASALAHGLQPVDLQARTLVPALQELAGRAERVFNIACEFQHDAALVLTDEQAALQFYLIAQEAISYAARHQHAEHLWLQLRTQEGRTTLTVRDDGRDPPAAATGTNGLARRIMQYRAELIGATFDSHPAGPDGGTIMSCSLPVKQ
jgi:PAS domain S-box-containing protein